ncbi:hypothetical protein BGX38DRAFT_680377 [Terfezia claveryi]|nr:hypothetical protein BGX38DRAFT_680377 [Terfezia claveryi]
MQSRPSIFHQRFRFHFFLCHLFPLFIGCSIKRGDIRDIIYIVLYTQSFHFGTITFPLHFSFILVGSSNLHIGKGNCDWVMHDTGLDELGRQEWVWESGDRVGKELCPEKDLGVIFPMS